MLAEAAAAVPAVAAKAARVVRSCIVNAVDFVWNCFDLQCFGIVQKGLAAWESDGLGTEELA